VREGHRERNVDIYIEVYVALDMDTPTYRANPRVAFDKRVLLEQTMLDIYVHIYMYMYMYIIDI